MASKYQVRPFPVERLIKPVTITGMDHAGNLVFFPYQEFTLVVVNGQLCYENKTTHNLIPIARTSRIQKLLSANSEE